MTAESRLISALAFGPGNFSGSILFLLSALDINDFDLSEKSEGVRILSVCGFTSHTQNAVLQ
jgi:hypothetical protein